MAAQFKMVDVPANAIWVNTGLSVTSDQTVVIHASGQVHMYVPEGDNLMPWVGPNGGNSRAECNFNFDVNAWPLVVNDATGRDHPAMLVAAVAANDSGCNDRANRFVVGKTSQFTGKTGTLYLCVNDYDMDIDPYPDYRFFNDNRGVFHVSILIDPPDECPQTGDDCEVNCHEPKSTNPIRLRTADKILSETDLSLQSPAGMLSFVRAYTQSKQADSSYQFMGLGWTHNHAVRLDLSGQSPDRVAAVRLPGGGTLMLDEDTAGHFVAQAGSTAVMDQDVVTEGYILTLADKSQYVFDDTSFQLRERRWPGGEKWAYSYENGNLTNVTDEYGRALVFVYYSGKTGDDAYKNGQLWRVGDQTATGLENINPPGRYVELDYTSEKSDGQVSGSKALLASVRDVRGQWWAYDYYGQHAGENNANLLNFLTRRESPEVDTDGDSVPDDPLSLEELTYSGSGASQIVQRRGNDLLETDFVFQPGSENVTTETVAGKTITHYFAGGVYVGTEDPLGNFPRQAILDDYRAWGKLDANGNPTSLDWSANGKHLDAVTDALGQETQFTYDEEDRLQTGMDAEGRQTSYVYDADHRQPTMIIAGATVTEVDINGGMEASGGWTEVGTPQINAQSSTQVDSGDSSRHVVADTVGEGIQSLTWDLEANQSYVIRARVYVVKGQVKMQVPDVAAFDAETMHTGVWETLTAEYTPSSLDAGSKCLQFVALTLDSGESEFYVDTVSITTTGEIDINGGMELDTGWSNVGTPTTNERSTAQVDSGAYSRHVVADAVSEGIQSTTWNLLAGQTYTIRARVYPVKNVGSQKVRMHLVDGSAQEIADTSNLSQGTNAWETLSCLYTPGADVTSARLQFLAEGGAAEFYVDTVAITLADMLPLHGDMEADNFWPDIPGNESQTNERSIRVDSGVYFRHVAVDAVNEGIESATWYLTQDHTYLVMARVYVVKGQVKMQVPDVAAFDAETMYPPQPGVWETLRAIYEHTGSTVSETLQFVAAALTGGEAEFYVDTVHLLDLDVISGARKDRLRWQEFAHDTKGRLLAERTINSEDATLIGEVTRSYCAFGPGSGLLYQVIQKDLDGVNDKITTYSYDSAGRVVTTQQVRTFGGCEASYTVYDAAGNVLASICNYEAGTHAPPQTAEEAAALYDSSLPDKNQVTAYRYDEMGRRVEVTTHAGAADDALTTLMLYDALNRVTRTISGYKRSEGSNPPGDWEWNEQAGQWEDGSQHPISHGTDNTENIIADTVYNARGQVRLQRDVLGRVTLYGYDDAGRQVKVVRSASQPDYHNDYTGTPNDPDLSDYNPVDNPDQDIITTAEFDAAGNLIRSVDPLGNAALMVYDALNRLVKTVRSASDSDYDIRHDPALAKYLFNNAPDLDLIEETVYEAMGRVLYTVNPAGNRTWYAYDHLDRPIQTIVNAQGTATDGGTGDPRSESYVASAGPDKDLISYTHYDDQGHVQWTLDSVGRRTWYVYDGLGRQVKTVANCTYDPEHPQGVPPEDPSYVGSSASDEDVISRTLYDTDGRVTQTIDARGNATCYAYDGLGRRTLTAQNFYDDSIIDTNLSHWEWSSTNARWEDGSGAAIPHGSDLDQNLITWTGYDLAGRVSTTRNTAGQETRYEYDVLGRGVRTIVNYEDGSYNPSFPDEDLISQTAYNAAGQVTATMDARGTQTSFEYDAAGRQVVIIQADETPLATKTYTCYDKAGRVLRVIINWVKPEGANPPSPDDRQQGNWVFAPATHGRLNDENLITEYELDHLGRHVGMTDPVGNETTTVFKQSGVVESLTDAEGVVTAQWYNQAQQLSAVVQNYHEIRLDQVAFVSNRDGGNYEIYLMNADGSHPTRLTTQSGRDDMPVWSPDGSTLAFVSDRSGSEEIYLLNVSRSDLVQLTHLGGSISQIAWSPEGDRIAFSAWVDYHDHVYVMSLRDTVPTRLTSVDINNNSPVWSPDGKRLAFVSQRDGNNEIYVMYRDGYYQMNLTQHSASDTAPAWSPDGTKILFESNRNGQSHADLYKMDQNNGANVVRLTNDGYSLSAAWSPAGDKIAFISHRNGSPDVFVMNADGSGQTQISTVGNCVRVSWSPDGSQIVFESSLEIYKVNVDGTQETRLTNNAADDMRPVWTPAARVIQPEEWVWNPSTQSWDDGWGHAVDHNAPACDRNVPIMVEYDKAGRRTALTDPRNNETGYEYDLLNRRTALTDPLSHTWQTGYEDLVSGGTRITLTDPASHDTEREFDRRGRLKIIDYLSESPKKTPKVTFGYDLAGNRATMVENNGVVNVRATSYAYDQAQRLTQVDFDTDGNGITDETVSYEYDAGGLRTRLILPGLGDPSVIYTYDTKGRLTSLTDWDSHTTTFAYDDANRLAAAERANGLHSLYGYDAAGHLRLLRHSEGARTLAHFTYEVDGRGNRTQALEVLAPPSGGGMVYAYDNRYIIYVGSWTNSAPYKVSSSFSAALTLMFFGDTAALTLGTGPDHSLFDVYINHSFWRSFDGYASASGERAIDIPLASMGPHLLEIRNRHEKNLASTGYKIRFKQLVTPNTAYIRYTYDALSRLQEARYNPASDLNAPDANLLRRYLYTYDLAGNRLSESVALNGGTATVTSHTYNPANQISNQGFAYDDNGNLTSDGANTYAWDRANRLLLVNNTAYQYVYDGLGSRVSQSVGGIVTQYLLDVQPGLVQVIAQTTGSSTSRFVIGPSGILAYKNGLGVWGGIAQDGLGSVRVEMNDSLVVQAAQSYAPYGVPFGVQGNFGLPFAFTGEMTDTNGLVYLRARYLYPTIGAFTALDPIEGTIQLSTTLNRYGYALENPINRVDLSGLCPQEGENGHEECIDLWQELKNWGIAVVFDENALAPCLDEAVEEELVDQRWTVGEMRAIHNAFRIFAHAHSWFSFAYPWPLSGTGKEIRQVRKVKNIPSVPEAFGDHIYENREIRLSASTWGEVRGIIDRYPYVYDAAQYRTWIVLHEFSHIFAEDRAEDIAARINEKVGYSFLSGPQYLESYLPLEIPDLGGLGFWGGGNRLPTDYHLATFTYQEFINEAITGTIWNLGYSIVPGFKSSAGGRTGEAGSPSAYANVMDILSTQSLKPGFRSVQEGQPPRFCNIPVPQLPVGISLQAWALIRLIWGVVEGSIGCYDIPQ